MTLQCIGAQSVHIMIGRWSLTFPIALRRKVFASVALLRAVSLDSIICPCRSIARHRNRHLPPTLFDAICKSRPKFLHSPTDCRPIDRHVPFDQQIRHIPVGKLISQVHANSIKHHDRWKSLVLKGSRWGMAHRSFPAASGRSDDYYTSPRARPRRAEAVRG